MAKDSKQGQGGHLAAIEKSEPCRPRQGRMVAGLYITSDHLPEEQSRNGRNEALGVYYG
jgi:hypothetical protein